MNNDNHNIANTYFTLLSEAKNNVRPPTEQERTDPVNAYEYANNVAKERVPELEPIIASDANAATGYALHVLNEPWSKNKNVKPEISELAENNILQDAWHSFEYANYAIQGRWLKAEPVIAENGYAAAHYAANVLHKRWPDVDNMTTEIAGLAENRIFNESLEIFDMYLREVVKDRWPEAELVIKQVPEYELTYYKFLEDIGYQDED